MLAGGQGASKARCQDHDLGQAEAATIAQEGPSRLADIQIAFCLEDNQNQARHGACVSIFCNDHMVDDGKIAQDVSHGVTATC